MLRYYDVNVNVGGPIKKDKAWFHFSWRKQFNSVEQPLFNFDSEFDTWNPIRRARPRIRSIRTTS